MVGIEVPNSEIATVSFRELWEQSKTDPNKLLEVPLGKAVDGSARSFDLGRMPHLLVAGSTGSGKSVAVNGIISSILMKARPARLSSSWSTLRWLNFLFTTIFLISLFLW